MGLSRHITAKLVGRDPATYIAMQAQTAAA